MSRLLDRLRHAILWLLGYRGVPRMARPSFRRELIGGIFADLASGAFVPPILQLFGRDRLGASDALFPILGSAVVGFHLVGLVVPRLLRWRRRVPCMVGARLALAIAAIVLSLLPDAVSSVPLFTAMAFLAFLAGSLSINVQAGIWHANFPDEVRGRIVTRLLSMRMATIAIGSLLASRALDVWDWGYHLVYAVAAFAAVLSAWQYSKIRVRREKQMQRRSRCERPGLMACVEVLWKDSTFGRYMAAQFLGGGANLMVGTAILLLAVTDVFRVTFSAVAGGFVVIPTLLAMAITPLSGHLFDRVPLMKMRSIGMGLWGVSRAVQYLSLVLGSWALLLVGFLIEGLTRGTAGVLWNVGHTRFSPPGQSERYMSVHMLLAGIRGLTMPALGYALYRSTGLGIHTVGVSAGVILLSSTLFLLLPEPDGAGGG